MISLLLGGALLAAGAYAAWQLFQHMQLPGKKEKPGDGADKNPSPRKVFDVPITNRDRMIRKIVNATTFATKQMVVGQTVVGTESRESIMPADEIEVRKMRSVNEIGKVLPRVHAMDDDLFFGALASQQMPVVQNVERVALTEPQYGKSRNVLVVCQDVSGSMEHSDRLSWAIRLNQKLVEKCEAEDAEYILILFHEHTHDPIRAKTRDEYRQMYQNLPSMLFSNGGTDIDDALRVAMDTLEEEQFGEARILLVTDGTQVIHANETQQRLKDLNVFLHTVVIQAEHDQLRSISNRYDELR